MFLLSWIYFYIFPLCGEVCVCVCYVKFIFYVILVNRFCINSYKEKNNEKISKHLSWLFIGIPGSLGKLIVKIKNVSKINNVRLIVISYQSINGDNEQE